jgi:hypothetical protein
MSPVRMRWASAMPSLLAAVLMTSCFDPEIPACLRCQTGECPRGQRCVNGYCASKGATCSESAAIETCADGRCCFGASCHAIDAPSELALWLDWTSIRPQTPERDLQVWLDRSGLGHDARSFGRHKWVVEQSPLGGGPVARSHFRDAALMVDEGRDDALGRLGSRDFLVLAAMSLPCDFEPRDNCLFQKIEVGPIGFWLGTIGVEELIAFVGGRGLAEGEGNFGVRAPAPALSCGKFYLFSLRRATTSLEIRVNGKSVRASPIPETLDADGNAPLQIGTGASCGSLAGATALAIAVDGPMSEGDACRLEQFALEHLASAALMERPTATACPGD